MRAVSQMDKDTVANLVTVGAVSLSMTDITIYLTLFSLATAGVLNLVRIFFYLKNGKQS